VLLSKPCKAFPSLQQRESDTCLVCRLWLGNESLAANSDLASEGSMRSSPSPALAPCTKRPQSVYESRPHNPQPPPSRSKAGSVLAKTRSLVRQGPHIDAVNSFKTPVTPQKLPRSPGSVASSSSSRSSKPPQSAGMQSAALRGHEQARLVQKQQRHAAFQAHLASAAQQQEPQQASQPPRSKQATFQGVFMPWMNKRGSSKSGSRHSDFPKMERITENGQVCQFVRRSFIAPSAMW
jgi:hypothetical protein